MFRITVQFWDSLWNRLPGTCFPRSRLRLITFYCCSFILIRVFLHTPFKSRLNYDYCNFGGTFSSLWIVNFPESNCWKLEWWLINKSYLFGIKARDGFLPVQIWTWWSPVSSWRAFFGLLIYTAWWFFKLGLNKQAVLIDTDRKADFWSACCLGTRTPGRLCRNTSSGWISTGVPHLEAKHSSLQAHNSQAWEVVPRRACLESSCLLGHLAATRLPKSSPGLFIPNISIIYV